MQITSLTLISNEQKNSIKQKSNGAQSFSKNDEQETETHAHRECENDKSRAFAIYEITLN